ncbi:hypothetical protein BDE02_01G158600 [Populus trichocarpa]|nr:hypothetical protein BDE02_01G158600 [Populus trichocarpa]
MVVTRLINNLQARERKNCEELKSILGLFLCLGLLVLREAEREKTLVNVVGTESYYHWHRTVGVGACEKERRHYHNRQAEKVMRAVSAETEGKITSLVMEALVVLSQVGRNSDGCCGFLADGWRLVAVLRHC